MNDAFALLNLPRRPWLDSNEVRASFQRLAATAHPDRSGTTAEFSALTGAYELLREPASRLRHFLALVQPERSLNAGVPSDLIEWFPRVAMQAQTLKRSTPLSGAEQTEAETLLEQLISLRDSAHAQIREIDTRWTAADFEELERLLTRLTFLDKWIAQLSEGLLALSL